MRLCSSLLLTTFRVRSTWKFLEEGKTKVTSYVIHIMYNVYRSVALQHFISCSFIKPPGMSNLCRLLLCYILYAVALANINEIRLCLYLLFIVYTSNRGIYKEQLFCHIRKELRPTVIVLCNVLQSNCVRFGYRKWRKYCMQLYIINNMFIQHV